MVFIQHRESIAQDQEKTDSLKSQMQVLEKNIEDLDAKIHNSELTLKDLRKLEDQKSTKTTERSTLFKEQQRQYAALAEENEGLSIQQQKQDSFLFFFSLSVGAM